VIVKAHFILHQNFFFFGYLGFFSTLSQSWDFSGRILRFEKADIANKIFHAASICFCKGAFEGI